MCKKNKSKVAKGLPASQQLNQSDMVREIKVRIQKVMSNWNPQFVISDETRAISQAILCDLEQSLNIIKDMWLPRSSVLVVDFYEAICQELSKFEDKDVLRAYSGDTVLKPSAEKILQTIRKWKDLD